VIIIFFQYNEKNKYAFGDWQSPKCFSKYAPLGFESLLLNIKDLISEVVGLELYPTYSYARIYYTGAILNPHTDRSSCEYSTTICIDSTDLWDFYIKDREEKENIVKLNPGDMCVYSGCELLHWRKPYEGKQQIQGFLHYVNANGPHKNDKFDGRPLLDYSKFEETKKKIKT